MIVLAFVTLIASLQSCAAGVAPRTMAAIVSVESSGWPLTIHDNTTARAYRFDDRRAAEANATELLTAGHSIDLGLAQINSRNLPLLGLSVHDVFDSCTNLRAGAAILRDAYASAVARFGPGQVALRQALSVYNSGSPYGAPAYVARVVDAAGVTGR